MSVPLRYNFRSFSEKISMISEFYVFFYIFPQVLLFFEVKRKPNISDVMKRGNRKILTSNFI